MSLKEEELYMNVWKRQHNTTHHNTTTQHNNTTHIWQAFCNEIGFEFITTVEIKLTYYWAITQNGKAMFSCYHGQTHDLLLLCSLQPVNIERTLEDANIRLTPSIAGIKNEWPYTSIPNICFQEFHTFNLLGILLVRNATSKCHLPSHPRQSALSVTSAENYMPHSVCTVRNTIYFKPIYRPMHSVLKVTHTIKYTNVR
jgi:hypothetical protein